MLSLLRFHWKRRWPALGALPVAGIMLTAGLASAAVGTTAAQTGSGAAAGSQRADSSVRIGVSRHVRVGDRAVMRGKVRPAGIRWVVVKVGKRKVKAIRTRADGTFKARWPTRRAGVYGALAIARGTDHVQPARSARKRLNVYRPAAASWYGPGFYGGRTACGKTLTTSTLGVANKSLPCGAKVTLRHRGRSVRVPVIDRGPFSGNREYDLTGATKAKLRFGSTGTVLTTR